MKRHIIFIFFVLFFLSNLYSQKKVNNELGYTLELIGQPVKSLPYLNFTLAEPEKGIESDILFNSFNPKGVFFIRYNHVQDKVTLHHLKKSIGLWGILNYDEEKVFLGGVTRSQLYEYNIKDDKINEVFASDDNKGFGWVFGEDYVWSLAKAADGKIYGSTYPNCKLFSYNPKTRASEDFGNMVEGEKYGRYVCADFPGKIFLGSGAHARLIEFDLSTKFKRQILPRQYQNQSFVYHLNRLGKYLAAFLSPDPIILIFDAETRQVVKEFNMKDYDKGLYLQKTVVYNNKLYFGMMPHDNLYSIDENLNLKLECPNAGGPIGLAQDRYLFCINTLQKISILDMKESKIVKSFTKNIEGENGVGIFSFTESADGNIYGSGFINQHIFTFNPDNRIMKDYGVSINIPGQVNSMICFKNKIYSGHYVTAEISEFDPKKEWKPGLGEDANPKVVTGIKNEQDKIIGMDTDGEKYIYIASLPTYGKLGGCFSIFEPETGYLRTFRNLIKNQGFKSIKLLNDSLIALGSYSVGSEEKSARLLIWNFRSESAVEEIEPVKKSTFISSIIIDGDNNLYSCADSTFFIYNYAEKRMSFIKELQWGNIFSLLFASDGFIYGVSRRAVFRFNPKDKFFVNLFTIETDSYTNYILQDKKGRIFIAAGENIYQLSLK
jgi:hypothetical protein